MRMDKKANKCVISNGCAITEEDISMALSLRLLIKARYG